MVAGPRERPHLFGELFRVHVQARVGRPRRRRVDDVVHQDRGPRGPGARTGRPAEARAHRPQPSHASRRPHARGARSAAGTAGHRPRVSRGRVRGAARGVAAGERDDGDDRHDRDRQQHPRRAPCGGAPARDDAPRGASGATADRGSRTPLNFRTRGRRLASIAVSEPPAPPSAESPLQGGCLCGAVRYEISAPALSARLLPLHALPAPHRDRLIRQLPRSPQAGFRLLSGGEQLRAYQPPTGVPKLFCRDLRLGAVQRGSVHR